MFRTTFQYTDTTQCQMFTTTTTGVARENFERTWPRCMLIEDLWQYAYGATGVPPVRDTTS
jgi:hypothetical protein